MNQETMYLVDSHSLIFQVFHGIPPMTSPKGLPTNAVFGFTRDMMFLRNKNPTYLVCGWDLPDPTFRANLFHEYKANRAEVPADLIIQLPLIQQVLDSLNIPIVSMPGFEADDVLATLAEHAKKKGIQVFLCTSDKDCRQLIDDRISLYSLRKQLEFGKSELKEDWGITPEQVVDLQTLVGDSVDNIPGADGIGIKTASSLLNQFGTIDEIYKNLDKISGTKRKENLAAFREHIPLVKKLVTLERNVPILVDWENWKLKDINAKKGFELFQSLGFRGFTSQMEKNLVKESPVQETAPILIQSRVLSEPQNPKQEIPLSRLPMDYPIKLQGDHGWGYDYHLVQSEQEFAKFHEELKSLSFFCFDTETTGLNPFLSELTGIAFCWKEGIAFYLPFKGPLGQMVLPKSCLKQLVHIFENPDIKKANQNIKFDALVLKNLGIQLQGVTGDSMVADYLLNAGARSHGLNDLAKKYLNHQMIEITEIIGDKGKGKTQKRMDEVDLELTALYSCEDADAAFRLVARLEKDLQGQSGDGKSGKLFRLYADWEIPLIEVLAEMQWVGAKIDTGFLKILGSEMENDLLIIEKEIYKEAGRKFQIASLPQLRQVLYEELKLPSLKKTGISKESSTDQETLEKLASLDHPGSSVPQKILEYRQITKLKNTYVDSLPELVNSKTGRVNALFNQTVAATGRLSSSEPNLQNIPIRRELGQQIRKAFVPADGCSLVCADYSQIELRLLAHFSMDHNLLIAFKNNLDVHQQVASEIYSVPETMVSAEMRRNAKTVNFGIIYGISAHGLAQRLRIPRDEAKKFIDSYLEKYPKVLQYQESLLNKCRNTGYVSTLLGRRRRIEGVRDQSSYQQRNQPEREAINMEIQGSAADLIKMAMIGVHKTFKENKLKARLIMQIHDELVVECPDGDILQVAEILGNEMGINPAKELNLKVPLVVDISSGKNWLDQTPLD